MMTPRHKQRSCRLWFGRRISPSKRWGLGVAVSVLLLIALPAAEASNIITVGVVDLDSLHRFFLVQSGPTQELRRREADLRETMGRLSDRTHELAAARLRALRAGDVEGARIIAAQLEDWEAHVRGLSERRRRELQAIKLQLLNTDPYYQAVRKAIVYVAETRGYTFVFDKSSSALAHVGNEVDITPEVRRLMVEWL